MANQAVGFASLLAGGMLIAAAITGASLTDVALGRATGPKGLGSDTSGGSAADAPAAESAPAIKSSGSPLASGKIIGTPGAGTHTLGNWESDDAYDIAVKTGTPVYAVADGTIGSQIGPLNSSNPRMAGLRLHLKTATNEFYYAHLSTLLVRAGDTVKAGQVIGYSGSANGVEHLHFAARQSVGDWIKGLTK